MIPVHAIRRWGAAGRMLLDPRHLPAARAAPRRATPVAPAPHDHADLAVDATTGTRFHPVGILFSLVFKQGCIVALGAPPVGVLAFELPLTAGSTFNHGNLRLPDAVDRALRWLVLTPDMHRVMYWPR
jgi:hypothetical protein